MNEIEVCGAEYGLTLNWKKVEALPIRCNPSLIGSDSSVIENKDPIIYLGSQISSDGRVLSELSRRLGMAYADFEILK